MAYQNWLCFDNAGHAQTISDFSTAHRSTFAISFLEKNIFSHFFVFVCIFLWKKTRLKNQTFSQLKTTCRLSHCRSYSILFISSHVLFIFHFLSFPTFFVIEKIIANLDHWHVDPLPLLSFADKKRIPNEAPIKWSIPKNGVWKSGTPFHPLLN